MTPAPGGSALEALLERVEQLHGHAALLRSAASDSEHTAGSLATDLKHQQRAAAALEKHLAALQQQLHELKRAQTPRPKGGRPRAQTSDELEREIARLHDEEGLDRRAILNYLRAFRPDLMRVSGTKSGLLTEKVVRRMLSERKRAQTPP